MPPSHGGDTGSTPVGSTICPSNRKVRGASLCGASHNSDHAQQQATEAFRDPQDLARDILRALPEGVGCLPREEVEGVLRELPGMESASLT